MVGASLCQLGVLLTETLHQRQHVRLTHEPSLTHPAESSAITQTGNLEYGNSRRNMPSRASADYSSAYAHPSPLPK